jgi:hypothetical protein
MPPPSTPVPLGQARSLLATKRFQTNISGWSAMSLLRLLTGTGNSPRGSGSCGGLLLVMLALSGLLTSRRQRRSTLNR